MQGERKELAEWQWWVYLLLDIYTSTELIIRLALSSDFFLLSLLDIGLALFRCFFFLCICYRLAGSQLPIFLFIPDLLMVMGLISAVAYGFVGYTLKTDRLAYFGTVHALGFLCVTLCSSCVLRVFIRRLVWSRFKVIVYKLARGYGVFLYLVFMLSKTYKMTLDDIYNEKLFMLFVILNLFYLEGMYGDFAAADGTAMMQVKFMIGEEPSAKESSVPDSTRDQ